MTRCYKCMEEYDEGLDKCPHCGCGKDVKPKELYHIVPGTIILGRYLVGLAVGQGGFGITYIGWDFQLERKVAIKEYFPSDFATRAIGQEKLTVYNGEAGEQFGKGLQSFIEEAQRLAKFNGIKGVVDIYDTFIENNTGYIVMEFLSGISVKDMLKANKVIDYPTAKEIVVEMLYILREVHKDGIIHRDIAPDNIFITDSGEFKLLDFGAARYASTSHSKSLSVILKPGYAPEEQYRTHGNQGPWTDIYALSATFYKLITGVTPPESMERRTGDTLIPPSKMGVVMPKNDEIALLNALNVLPENRIQSAQEFLDALGGKKITRKKERNLRPDTGRMYKFVLPLVGLSAAAVLGFVVGIKTGIIHINTLSENLKADLKLPEGYQFVNNVVGENMDDAKNVLVGKNFVVEYGEAYHSDSIAENLIAAQTPASGAEKEGSKIILLRSLGPACGELGMFNGRRADEVKAELDEKGFYNVAVVESKENTMPKGTVEKMLINDKPVKEDDFGSGDKGLIRLSSKIVIEVSNGEGFNVDTTKKISVPNYVGKKYQEVVAKISADKLVVGSVTQQFSDTVAEGVIISQNPAGGEVNEGSAVNFVVSKGKSQPVAVPNMLNISEQNAKAAAAQKGLNVNISYEYSDMVQQGLVISQGTPSGTKLAQGSTVNIVVSRGRRPSETKVQTEVTTRRTEISTKARNTTTTTRATTTTRVTTTERRTEATTRRAETTTKRQTTTERRTETTTRRTTTTETTTKKVEFKLDSNSGKIEAGKSVNVSANKPISSVSSSNSSVAYANGSGYDVTIYGEGAGSAEISIRSSDGDIKTYKVTVTSPGIPDNVIRPTLRKNRETTAMAKDSSGSCGVEVVHPNSRYYEVRVSGASCVKVLDGTKVEAKRVGTDHLTIEVIEIPTGNVVATEHVTVEVLPKDEDDEEDDDDERDYDDDDDW